MLLAFLVLGCSLSILMGAPSGTVMDFDVPDFDRGQVLSISAMVRATATLRPGLDLSVWVENSLFEGTTANGLNSLLNPVSVEGDRQSVLDDFAEWMKSVLVPSMEGTLFEIQEVTGSQSPGLNILLLDIQDGFEDKGSFVGAHFLPQDQDPAGGWNGMNILYVDLNPGTLGIAQHALVNKRRTYMELTRVLSRLIQYQRDSTEENWVKEGISQYSVYRFLNSVNFPRSSSKILDAPTASPVEVNAYLQDITRMRAVFPFKDSDLDRVRIFQNPREPADNKDFEYFRGFSYLFFTYLFQRGDGDFRSRVSDGDRLFREILDQPLDGIEGLDLALSSRALGTFSELYKDYFLALQLPTTETKYNLESYRVPLLDLLAYPLLDDPNDPPVLLVQAFQPSIVRVENPSGTTQREIHFSAPSGIGKSDVKVLRKDAAGNPRVETIILNDSVFEFLPPGVEKWVFMLNLEQDSRNYRIQQIESRFTQEVPFSLFLSDSAKSTVSKTEVEPATPFPIDTSLVPTSSTTSNLLITLSQAGIFELYIENSSNFPVSLSLEDSVITTQITLEVRSESLASLSSLVPVTDEKVVILREGSRSRIAFYNENTQPVTVSLFVSAFDSELFSDLGQSASSLSAGLTAEQLQAIAGGGAGGCFVATAAYGTKNHPIVLILNRFRDEILMKFKSGRDFVNLYYLFSPPLAGVIAESSFLKLFIQLLLVPLTLFTLVLLNPLFFTGFLLVFYFFARVLRGRGR